jgi:hypothetical protein
MKIEVVLILVAIILLSISSYLLYNSYFSQTHYFKDNSEQNNHSIEQNINNSSVLLNEYPEGMLFYDFIRFPDKIINYSIDVNCNKNREENIASAFSYIQNETILRFNQVNDNGQIESTCSEDSIEMSGGYFIAGEGGPFLIINTTKYQVIVNGKILIFSDEKCDRPIVEIHEILHVLGFKHSINKKSIMYNISDCSQIITDNIKMKINELYKDPSLPDLEFKDVNATKKGMYVDFEAEIINSGLSKSGNTKLSVYSDNEKVSSYDLGSLDIGSGKLITVENLRVFGSPKNMIFIIDEENSLSEINKKNNKRILTLQ